MGFLTRLLAGLLAASTLGTGLAGTTNAVDVTGAAGNTKSVVKLTADGGNETSEDTADNPDDDSTDADSTTDAGAQSDAGQQAEIQSSTSQDKATAKSSLPDHIVNGSFDYPACPDGKNSCDVDPTTGWGGFYVDYGRKFMPIPDWNRSKFGWDSSQEGLRPDQQPNSHQKLQHCVQIGNKPNNNGQKMNRFAEIIAETPDEYIYQDIATTPGVMYRWSLKHASEDASHVDSMQVTIGSPGKETAQDATRTTSNGRGDRTGVTSKTIATKGGQAEWETYTGVYIATSTVTRFTFKSAQGRDSTRGNFIDDVMFTKAYKLTYDKNSADASGQVPSNQRGKENTTQPAKNKTNGKIRLASDTSKLSDHLVNSDFEYLPDGGWKTVDAPSYMRNAYTSVDPNNGQYMRNAKHVDADLASWVDWPGFDQSKFAWKTDQKGGHDQGGLKDRAEAVELQQDSTDGNTYAEMVASETGRTIYQNLATIPGTLYKIRLKHASLCKDNVDQMQVVINGTPIEMTRVTANGKAGDKVGEKSTTIGTRVTNENRWHHSDQWETYEGYYVIPDGQTTTRFGFKAVNYLDPTKGNLLDDVTFARAYKLSYDKNASDATGSVPSNQRGKENTVQPAEARGTGTVKTVADGDSSKSLTVNPGFDVPDYSKLNDGGLHWMYVNPAEGKAWSYYDYINPAQPVQQVAGLSQATFGWQELTGGDHKTTAFELHREKDGNVCADVHGSRTIGQTIDTQAGVAYTVSIRHSGRSKGNAGSVQVLVGPDRDHLRPLEMSRMNVSRTGAKYGDRIGSVGTVVTTHSDSVDSTEGDHPAWDHADDWETYSGTYVATGGKTVFAYRGVDKNGDSVIDDLSFKLAYRLTYDKNAQDAAGSVPSSQYGKENTVQPAKAKTTGSVRLAADKTASGLTVHDLKNGEIAPVQYGDFKFSTVNGFSADQVTNVNGFTVKTNSNPFWEALYTDGTSTAYFPTKNGASLVLHHVGQWRDSSGTQRWLNARITVNGQNLGFLYYEAPTHHFNIGYGKWDKKPSSRPYMDVTVDFLLDDGSTPQGLRGVTGFTDLDGGTSGYNEGVELVSGFDGAYVRSDAHLTRFGTNGWAGTTDENAEVADEHGMKHYVGATFTGSSFRVRWSVASGQARAAGFQPVDSTIAYRLTYNKNAQDATGSIPSDTAANTTQPAKSETDGKVSDLVQRTTTHEDGSVTVKTIDTSTDVVSGCQVYYPAGQRITLATMAKDDDCWDASMLSRPGHTQLGWNQDRNATAAQPEVTMVEGGMTVYAVWVGNPVLTYDTNKPSTWSGQMPSTPASVSVAYNTAAADGSGWAAGDTSKIRGYKFLGWYTAPQDNTGLYQWATPLTGNVTVYAHWQRLQANVIYNANGGTGSHPNTTGWQYSDVTIPGDTSKSFKRTGYRFAGWNTAKDGKGTAYADGGRVPLQGKDVTLYAQWAPLFDVLPSAGGDYGPSVPWLVCGGLALVALAGGVASTLLRLRKARGAHSR